MIQINTIKTSYSLWWHTPIVPIIQEAEVGRLLVSRRSKPVQGYSKTLSKNKNKTSYSSKATAEKLERQVTDWKMISVSKIYNRTLRIE